MVIIPAIDLLNGHVVRLFRGDPSLSKFYSASPVEIAKKWRLEGAELLHIVDLSAALGEKNNQEVIEEIIKEVNIKVEVGGGIRTLEKAQKLISLGVERIVIGTKGVDEKFLKQIVDSLGKEKVAVSVDVIHSFLAVEGWQKKTELKGIDFITQLKDKGIKWIIYTDISRDGTLKGADYEEIKKLAGFKNVNIIFSGGISSLSDIKKIKEDMPFIWGVIVGKALYEGKIDLSKAFQVEKVTCSMEKHKNVKL